MGRLGSILYTKRAMMMGSCLLLGIGILIGEKLGLLPGGEQPSGVHVAPNGREIAIAGPITGTLERAVQAALEDNRGVRVVRFISSPGGSPSAARAIRAMIEERRLDTVVTGTCVSTCAVAFMAGQRRFWVSGARLGFQRASLQDSDGLSVAFMDKTQGTFIAIVWYPSLEELRAEGIVTDIATPGAYPLVSGG